MAPKCTSAILKKLRDVMKNTTYVSQSLQAYFIPYCDAHQSEYMQPCDHRLAFVSGFTGSAGKAIVTEKKAALWTDGRYYLQAAQEMDENWKLMKDGFTETPTCGKYLNEVLPVGSCIGVDPFLLAYDAWETLSNEIKKHGHKLIPVDRNLIDVVWDDKPSRYLNEIECLPLEYTGKDWQDKVKEIQRELHSEGVSALVVTALDEIAWLFNLRGSDIPYNPVFFSYAIVTQDSVYLLTEMERVSSSAKASLGLNDTTGSDMNLIIGAYRDVADILKSALDGKNQSQIWISKNSSYAVVSLIPEANRLLKDSPICANKSLKNETEINNAKTGHIRDAVALCEYFCWLSQNVSKGNITEVTAAEKLEEFKKTQEHYVGPSFETISSCGQNAAVIHYHPSKEHDRKLSPEEIYLCDSGSQYRDGSTTDVTRTLHFGIPSAFEKKCYTLVLKGHIAVSTAMFPMFTKGNRLDSFARRPLWEAGLDYQHGTGHGVGAYLNVHEGPMGIGFRPYPSDVGLQPGMILSIEPGFYQDGEFGIRLENLAFIKKINTEHKFQDIDFLTFEPLTLVPFQTKLIEPSLLTQDEVKWLNNYHAVCYDIVGKVLKEHGKTDALQWLFNETQRLG